MKGRALKFSGTSANFTGLTFGEGFVSVGASAHEADGTRAIGTTLGALSAVPARETGAAGEAGSGVAGKSDLEVSLAVGLGELVSCGVTDDRGAAGVCSSVTCVV